MSIARVMFRNFRSRGAVCDGLTDPDLPESRIHIAEVISSVGLKHSETQRFAISQHLNQDLQDTSSILAE